MSVEDVSGDALQLINKQVAILADRLGVLHFEDSALHNDLKDLYCSFSNMHQKIWQGMSLKFP
jgi:hypothetical protein